MTKEGLKRTKEGCEKKSLKLCQQTDCSPVFKMGDAVLSFLRETKSGSSVGAPCSMLLYDTFANVISAGNIPCQESLDPLLSSD